MEHKNKWFVRGLSLFLCCLLLASLIVPARGTVALGQNDPKRAEAAAVAQTSGPVPAGITGRMAYEAGAAFSSITETKELLDHTQEDEIEFEVFSLSTAAAPAAGEVTAQLMNITAPLVFDKVITNVTESLNIRSRATTESEVVGKLYKNSYAEILERGEEWTKVKSGSVTGYVSNEYLYFDGEALEKAFSLDAFQAEVTAGTVNVRKGPGLDEEVIKVAKKGETFNYIPDLTTEEWTAVELEDGTTGYLYSEFTEEDFALGTAVSKAELDAQRREAEIAKSLENAKNVKVTSTNRAPVSLSDDDIFLMSVVIMMEAGYESYEGQLAVANVLVNRLLSGRWGNTMSDVVYAPGQFSGANSGRIERFAPKVTESCKKAAVEALAGNNNIGSFMSFIMKSRAKYSSYSEYYVLGGHCFYKR